MKEINITYCFTINFFLYLSPVRLNISQDFNVINRKRRKPNYSSNICTCDKLIFIRLFEIKKSLKL